MEVNPSLLASQDERRPSRECQSAKSRRAYFREAKRRSRANIRKFDPTYDRPIKGMK